MGSAWRRNDVPPDRFRAVLGSAYEQMLLAASGGRRLVEKTPVWSLQHLDFLASICPDAYYLLLYRDGRNQVASLEVRRQGHTDPPFDFADACRRWAASMEVVARAAADPPAARLMLLRYEDLVERFDPTFEAVCRFIEIAPFRAEPMQPNSSFPDRPGAFNHRWADWPDDRKAIFKREAGAALARWGYVADAEDW